MIFCSCSFSCERDLSNLMNLFHLQSNDSVRSTNSTGSNGSSSNVIVVTNGNGNGFKSKCVSMPNKLLSAPSSAFARNDNLKNPSSSSSLQPASPRSPSSRRNPHSTSSHESERMNNLLEEDEDGEMSNEKTNGNMGKTSIVDSSETLNYSGGTSAFFRNATRNETCI